MKINIQESTMSEMFGRIFNRFSDPVSVSSLDSRVLYANPAFLYLSSLKTASQIEEKYYEEVQSPLYQNENAVQSWKDQDQYLLNHQSKELTMLEVHPKGASSPYINKKIPFYDENHTYVGVINHIKYLELYQPNDFIKGKLPRSLLLNKPDDSFSERQYEVIFLFLQRMTAKKIADILSLSFRTIENIIQVLYKTAKVNNYTDFMEFCEKRNLNRYLPRRFIDSKRFSFEGSNKI